MIRQTLEATRAQLVAAIAVLDVALEAMDTNEQQQATVCQHEMKVTTATLTNPGSWYCPGCGAQGDAEAVARGGMTDA